VSSLRTVADRAATILAAVQREYPNAPRHVMHDDADQVTPRGAHPAFYGCYDWHSAVEMHWALVVLLRFQPEDVPADDIRSVVDAHLTANPDWERPYGWGWGLQLAGELEDWAATGDPDATRWAEAVRPLAWPDHALRQAIGDSARTFYGDDTAAAVRGEPSGPRTGCRRRIERRRLDG
jgi:Protein of unknown function (DUF2891)